MSWMSDYSSCGRRCSLCVSHSLSESVRVSVNCCAGADSGQQSFMLLEKTNLSNVVCSFAC